MSPCYSVNSTLFLTRLDWLFYLCLWAPVWLFVYPWLTGLPLLAPLFLPRLQLCTLCFSRDWLLKTCPATDPSFYLVRHPSPSPPFASHQCFCLGRLNFCFIELTRNLQPMKLHKSSVRKYRFLESPFPSLVVLCICVCVCARDYRGHNFSFKHSDSLKAQFYVDGSGSPTPVWTCSGLKLMRLHWTCPNVLRLIYWFCYFFFFFQKTRTCFYFLFCKFALDHSTW